MRRSRGWAGVRLRRPLAIVTAVIMCLSLAACSQVIVGTPHVSDGVKDQVPDAQLQIKGDQGTEIDTLAKNALSDIQAYWEEHFESDFGTKWTPLEGGYYSVDPAKDSSVPCFDNPKDAEGNAFYCPSIDAIVYDRTFLQSLADEFGKFIVPLVLSHEFGHALQMRAPPDSDRSIVIETQADCMAGVWVSKVADGGTAHFELSSGDLDAVLGGYLLFRDPVGTSSEGQIAHGSGFDRISAFQDGYEKGSDACISEFTDTRVFTSTGFADGSDAATNGNGTLEATLEVAKTEFNTFWQAALPQSFGTQWQQVTAEPVTSPSAAECEGEVQHEAIFYCPDGPTVNYDQQSLVPEVYDKIGDFAVLTLFGLEYSDAVLEQVGSSLDGTDRFDSMLCLTGAFSGAAFALTQQGQTTPGGSSLSPGDLDEAVAVLIAMGSDNKVVDTENTDAFSRVAAFREGFDDAVISSDGIGGCDVG